MSWRLTSAVGWLARIEASLVAMFGSALVGGALSVGVLSAGVLFDRSPEDEEPAVAFSADDELSSALALPDEFSPTIVELGVGTMKLLSCHRMKATDRTPVVIAAAMNQAGNDGWLPLAELLCDNGTAFSGRAVARTTLE